MTDPYYLTDGAHVLIAGATGAGDDYGGKSVLGNWWFYNAVESGWHDMGLFYNPKGLTYVRGDTVNTLTEFAEFYRQGSRLFDFRPRDHSAHEKLIETLKLLPGRKIVVHDEAQMYRDLPSLNDSLAAYGNMAESRLPTDDIRSLVVTQRPWNLSEELRANLPIKIWVGPFGNEAEHFFNAEQMGPAKDAVRDATGPYRWNVTDAGDYVETNPPIPEKYAESR